MRIRIKTMSVTKHFNVETVVFDLFHTVVDPDDFRPKDFHKLEKIAELFKIDLDPFQKYWEETRVERYTSKARKSIDYVEKYVAKTKGEPVSKADLVTADVILGRYEDMAIRNPETAVRRSLSALKYYGKKVGLVANVEERDIDSWLSSILATQFDAVCFSCETGQMKPAKQAYSTVLGRLASPAQSSIYVGDGDGQDLSGAREAGFGLVVFVRGHLTKNGSKTQDEIQTLASIADTTIDSVAQIPALVEQIQST
jgi:putative hydrolase of the HAD superfamily